jgi:hypothetical protein
MAGSPREVIAFLRQRRPVLIVAGLFLLCAPALPQEDTGTVLLLEHPDRFILYNKYQQRLTTGEYRALPSTVPFLLVREVDRLNDGLTPCAAVHHEGDFYYIQRDHGGGFSKRGAGGSVTLYRDASLFGDTIALLKGAPVRMRNPSGTGEIVLTPGTRARRIFASGGRTFIRTLSGNRPSGWIALPGGSPGGAWTLVRESPATRMSAESVMERLAPLVAEANRALAVIYARLAAETNTRATAPAFRLRSQGDLVRCALEPQSLSSHYEGSLRELVPAVERGLGGTGLHPILTGGAIEIPLR